MLGKQIRFYLTPIDEALLFEEIKKNADSLVTEKNEPLNIVSPSDLNDKSISQAWIKSISSKLYFSANGFIDRDKSEVIIYSRSISLSFFKPPKVENKSLKPFRLSKDLNVQVMYKGKLIREWDLNDEQLIEMRSNVKNRWDREPSILDSGRLWMSIRYFEDDMTIEKDKWVIDWYDSYVKWIKKNCRLSKNKDSYIGEDAYKKYKDRTLVIQGAEWE